MGLSSFQSVPSKTLQPEEKDISNNDIFAPTRTQHTPKNTSMTLGDTWTDDIDADSWGDDGDLDDLLDD